MWHRTRFLSFWTGFWVVPAFFVLPPPPFSAGAGLGNQTDLSWHRTRFLSFWAWFGLVPAFFVLPTPPRSVPDRGLSNRAIKLWHRTVGFSCSFLFRPADPPPARSWGASGYFGYSDCGAGPCDSLFSLCRWYNFASPPSLRLRYFGFCICVDPFSPRPPFQVI